MFPFVLLLLFPCNLLVFEPCLMGCSDWSVSVPGAFGSSEMAPVFQGPRELGPRALAPWQWNSDLFWGLSHLQR